MSSPESQQFERLERQIYEYYPHLQRDCEELKCVRRQRLIKQLRIGHPLVEVSRLDAQASVMNLKFLLEGCRSLGMFNEPMYSQNSGDLLTRCSQLSESSEDELRHMQSMYRTTRKRKFTSPVVQSSNYRYTKRSRGGSDPDAPLSLTIRLPEILPMKISIGCEQHVQRRHNALSSSSSSNASEVSVTSGKANEKPLAALTAADEINPEETASSATQEDEMLTRLISEVLVEPEAAETWRATSVLDNINNNVSNNYDVHTAAIPTSSQKSKKARKQSKKQTKNPNEPPKKRGRKKKVAIVENVESNANGLPKSDLAKYVELFSNSCNMTGSTTPAHITTTPTAQQPISGAQEPVTYYIETDWPNSGNCQLIPTESVSIEGTQEEFNMTELVDYIENVDNDAGNVIASVLDAPGTIIPVTSNIQVPVQQLQIYQPSSNIRPVRNCEGVLDLSKKPTTLRASFALTTEPIAATDDDCVPLDLSMKSAAVLARPATPQISQATTQGPFMGDDYDSFNAALDMPIIDIDDNMSAFMEMTNRASSNVTTTKTTLTIVEDNQLDTTINQDKNVASLPTLVDISETSNSGIIDYPLDLPNELLEIGNTNESGSNIELIKNQYQTAEKCADAVMHDVVYKSVGNDAESINNASCNRNFTKCKSITKHSEYITKRHTYNDVTNSITDSSKNEPINYCVVDLKRDSGHSQNAEKVDCGTQVDCGTGLNLSKSDLNVLRDHDNSIQDMVDIRNAAVVENVTSEQNCNDVIFDVDHNKYINLNENKEGCSDSAVVLVLSYNNSSVSKITANSTFDKGCAESNAVSSVKSTLIDKDCEGNNTAELLENKSNKAEKEEFDDKCNCVVDNSSKEVFIEHTCKAIAHNIMKQVVDHKDGSRINKGCIENNQPTLHEEKQDAKSIASSDDASGSISDKVSVDLLFVDVESLPPRKSTGKARTQVQRCKDDTLNYKMEAMASNDVLLKEDNNEHLVNNENFNSIDLVENAEDNDSINIQMPQLTLIEHNSEEFAALHLDRDSENGFESSDSMVVGEDEKVCVEEQANAEASNNVNISVNGDDKVDEKISNAMATVKNEPSNETWDVEEKVGEKLVDVEEKISEHSINVKVKANEQSIDVEVKNSEHVIEPKIDVEEKINEQPIHTKAGANEQPIDVDQKVGEQLINVKVKASAQGIDFEIKADEEPIDVKVKANEQLIGVEMKVNESPVDAKESTAVQFLNIKCKEQPVCRFNAESVYMSANARDEIINEENEVGQSQNATCNQQPVHIRLDTSEQSMNVEIGTNELPADCKLNINKQQKVAIVSSEQQTDKTVKKMNSPRPMCLEVEEASQQSESLKPSCSTKSKKDADLFTSLSVLEMESKLDDVCLDFEGEMDEDALSLATSCFNSPVEDRFADIDVDMQESIAVKNEVADIDDVENYITPTCNIATSSEASIDRNSMTNVNTTTTVGLKKFKIPKISTTVAMKTTENPHKSVTPSAVQPPMVVLPPSTTITSQDLMSRPVGLDKLTRTVQNVCAVPPLPLQPTALIAASVAAVTNPGIAPVPSRIRDILQLPPTSVKLTKEYTLNELGEDESDGKFSRGVLAGRGGEGLNYGPGTLDVAKTFGITCLPFLVDKCFALASCQLSHIFRDLEVVENFLETLTESDLSVAYKFMYNHVCLFQHYFKVFCKVYARRNNRNKLLNMVYDCMRYGDCAESLRTLFCSLTHCGFSKVNACRQILSRNREKSRAIIDVLVSIIMESDWTMFCDYIERFTETPSYHFRINVLNQMAPTVLRANNPRLAAVFFKCLVDLEPDDVALVQHSPAMLQLLELTKSGKMCC